MRDEKPIDLVIRTREFALSIIQIYSALPKEIVAQVLGKQLLRSGTSVGAHYREAKRARSNAEFISKIEASGIEIQNSLTALMREADQLLSILTACAMKAKERN